MDTTATTDSGAPAAHPAGLARRAALGGIAATIGGVLAATLAGRAGAQEEDGEATTTAPPTRPTSDDVALLAFANSLELAAVELYQEALATGALGEETAHIATAFANHHRQYATAIAGLLGSDAPNQANAAVVDALRGDFGQADEMALLSAAYELESAAVATHTALLGELEGINGAALVASIQPVEARHAVVLGRAAGMDIPEVVPEVESTDAALDPADYPIAG